MTDRQRIALGGGVETGVVYVVSDLNSQPKRSGVMRVCAGPVNKV